MTPTNDMPLMADENENIVLFYPHVSKLAQQKVFEQLGTRWIGQGPSVGKFDSRGRLRN